MALASPRIPGVLRGVGVVSAVQFADVRHAELLL